jgi:hypothetical protein
MKYLNLFILTILVSWGSYAQDANVASLDQNWSPFMSVEGLEVSINKVDCPIEHTEHIFTYAFLRFKNTSNKKVTVNYQVTQMYTDGSCAGCDATPESQFKVELEPGQTLEGDCSFERGELSVLVKNPLINSSGVELKTIKLTNLTVK